MCWAEKCCFFIPLDFGCVLLGAFTFMVSFTMCLCSVILLTMEHVEPSRGAYYLDLATHLDLNSASVKVILSLFIIAELMWMMCSVLLIVGIKKNRPSLVLTYFSFGIVVTILSLLNALLVLLANHWILSLVAFLAALLYVHCLVAVHSAYELMQRGKVLGNSHHDHLDEDELISSTE